MDSTLTRISASAAPFSVNNFQKLHVLSSSSSTRISAKRLFCSDPKLEITSTQRPQYDAVLDEYAFEAQRLRLDSKAREAMAQTSKREMEADTEDDPKAWKWVIRKRIWDFMEARNFAQNPRPVHHRIPNFVGASAAAKNLAGLEVFQNADCVKVNPDSPQKQVRFLTLSGGKKLLTPQPRLRTGFFSVLESNMLPPNAINEACTSVGGQEGSPKRIAAYLYRQSAWLYLQRTIMPSVPNPQIHNAVDEGLHFLRNLPPDSSSMSILLMPLYLLGLSAFAEEQRPDILKAFDDLQSYSNLGNIKHARRLVQRIWEMMDAGDEGSWDFEKVQKQMGLDFLVT